MVTVARSLSTPAHQGPCRRWPSVLCAASPWIYPDWTWPSAAATSTPVGAARDGGCRAALDAQALDRCHLVGHDIGGPIWFGVAACEPDRVLSLRLLNTIVAVETFRRVQDPGRVPREPRTDTA